MAVSDWKKSVVYQIYPKSFNDTTGNGQGDINGVIEKLPYLQKLGVDYVWLTPIYESPMNDNGYDISDYYAINPDFGTKEDIEKLLTEAHKLGIKVMLDIVINHTSTSHHWFVESRKSKDNPYRDYYIWKEGTKDEPPTNWESKFGGNAWEYDEQTESYYLRLFDVSQADLNWENDQLKEEIYEMINYWIDFGVDGFRFDVINLISKGAFEDSEEIGKEFYTDGPKVHEYLHELNRKTFGNKDIMTVGEMSSTTIENCIKYTNPERQELNSVFNFHHLKVDYKNGEKWSDMKFDFIELKRILMDWQVNIAKGNGWNAIFWCNHDQPRVVTRFGNDETEANRVKSAKMLAISLHMLQGTPYIYQGEEIGMTDPKFTSIDQYRDIETLNAYRSLRNQGLDEDTIMKVIGQKSRDNSRTPVQWTDEENAGFTTGTPWIGIPDNYREINVEAAIKDKNSIFYTYQRLIDIRHKHDIITYGDVEPLYMDHPDLFIYKRKLDNEEWLIVANYTNDKVEIPEDIDMEGELIVANNDLNGNMLEPFDAFVVNLKSI
ncbi:MULTISPECIES: alpha,alpha-phosphotrehalase [Mammaliicoccus]|uniref:alpha,alpha-phosphotrehalase n=1 Tax=Mammaliicoccus TaxID=2803850 RepID=UPI000CD2E2CD|nr:MULTISPECIES: alpha,alpha-phosphotrehalase [Mammaliicoccus]HBV04446.1 alpha,alpha-phosphotrehalase [Staphylococcus sp.]MBW0768566.1 alpha,alpha-phosphotrehalase [Mammaliicoccus lentus]MDQ7143243.1 alpha,alpha-phosphotrehalase [Mammaliicoccus lentus]POA07662.1 alpha,alpha-phosphotrehalase [Mammaliicoccus lentus]WHI54725.1 alpha,alpha-phosphotrehalase [Mammaliicoccus lentus]